MKEKPRALSDLKVVECGDFVSAPYCAKLLADMGAEVIKIEQPGVGDRARAVGPFPDDIPHPERSGLFLYMNTNKLSITLDVSTSQGKSIARRLLKEADVFVENNPPRVMEELGFDYETQRKVNPRLVVTSITPFGQTGPYRDYKAYDINLFHMGGLGYITAGYFGASNSSKPVKGPENQASIVAGIHAAAATLCTLFSQNKTGSGQQVDISVMKCIASLIQFPLAWYFAYGHITARENIIYWLDECKDGLINIISPRRKDWHRWVDWMMETNPDLAKEEWCQNHESREECWELLDALKGEWLKRLTKQEVFRNGQSRLLPTAIGSTTEDLFNDEHYAARGFFVEVDHPETEKTMYPGAGYHFSETPWAIVKPAPRLGEHNEEIYCKRLGYTKGDLVKMRGMGII